MATATRSGSLDVAPAMLTASRFVDGAPVPAGAQARSVLAGDGGS
jgi:hypothetical protein